MDLGGLGDSGLGKLVKGEMWAYMGGQIGETGCGKLNPGERGSFGEKGAQRCVWPHPLGSGKWSNWRVNDNIPGDCGTIGDRI